MNFLAALIPLAVLGVIGMVLGLTLTFADSYFEVKEDPRVDGVEKLLPNYNCGACGTPGCRAFATAIINGDIKELSKCKPGKADKHFNPILAYLKDNPNPDGTPVDVKI